MTTQISPIHATQRKARETSRGRILVIAEGKNGLHGYDWTIYDRGVGIDSGHSTALPHAVMLRERWQRIDFLQHVELKAIQERNVDGNWPTRTVSVRLV